MWRARISRYQPDQYVDYTCTPDNIKINQYIAGKQAICILPALPSSSSGQGGPTGTRGLSHAETFLGDLDNHQSYKTKQ